MNATKLVDTCNVEALDPTEAKAAFLSLYKQQRPWIEITDDPATWPPTERLVVVRDGEGLETFGVRYTNPLKRSDYRFFRSVCNVEWDREGQPLLYFDDYDAPRIYDVTHWRSI